MKYNITKLLVGVMAFGLAAVNVQAGEINSAEQSAINQISQPFEYDGSTYVVNSQYISQGEDKLSSDDVDLSKSEADSYVSEFRDSYAEVVSEGYADKVSGSGNSSTSDGNYVSDDNSNSDSSNSDSTNSSNDSKKSGKKDKSSKATASPTHSPSETAVHKKFLETVFGEGDTTGNNSESDSSGSTSATETPDDMWDEEEDLGTTIEFNADDVINAQDDKLVINTDSGSYTIDDDISSNVVSNMTYFKQFKIVLYVVAVLSLIVVLLIVYYIIKIKKHKHKKRNLRTGIAISAGIVIAGWMALLLYVFSLYFGVYNKSAIHRQMMESDYFTGITQMTRELVSEELDDAGYDQDIASDVFTLSNVYIEEKQYIDMVLSGDKEAEVSTTAIHEVLTDKLDANGSKSDEQLISDIESTYTNVLKFTLGNVIYQSNANFIPWFYITSICGILLIILLFILMREMYGYMHKSVRVGATGMLVASVIMTAVFMFTKLRGTYNNITTGPQYYQQFVQKYVAWDIKVFVYIGIIGILISIALFVWKRYLHMIYVE